MHSVRRLTAGLALALLAGCAGGDATLSAARQQAGGVSWAAPRDWTVQPERAMRAATYGVPGPGGEAELAVFFFGAGQGGGIEANLSRWRRQFTGAGGGPAAEVGRGILSIGGLRVTTLELTGTFVGSSGPMSASAPSAPRPGWAMRAAIVEAPTGPVFFKLTGPEETVEHAREPLHELIRSLQTTPASPSS